MVIGAVIGIRLNATASALLGDSMSGTINQKGMTMGRVNKPAHCCASRVSDEVAPMAAISPATMTKAGSKVKIIKRTNSEPIFKFWAPGMYL